MARRPASKRRQTGEATPPEFKSWESFGEFARAVRFDRRYVFDREVQLFLETVRATSKRRETSVKRGSMLYRAQRGVDEFHPSSDDPDEEDPPPSITGLPTERMKPDSAHSLEGRVSPAGICVLYLASSKTTAISEIRPWVGSEVSVGSFEVVRDLRAIDLSVGHGRLGLFELTLRQLEGAAPVDRETKERAVWIDIDNAFSKPVTRDSNPTDYIPTQILAELFRDAGYEALVYRSQFGKGDAKGYNVALFDLADAEIISCEPHRITRIALTSEPTGNAWYRSRPSFSRKQ